MPLPYSDPSKDARVFLDGPIQAPAWLPGDQAGAMLSEQLTSSSVWQGFLTGLPYNKRSPAVAGMLLRPQVNPAGPQTHTVPGFLASRHSPASHQPGATCPARQTAALLKLRACQRALRRAVRKHLTACKSSQVQDSAQVPPNLQQDLRAFATIIIVIQDAGPSEIVPSKNVSVAHKVMYQGNDDGDDMANPRIIRRPKQQNAERAQQGSGFLSSSNRISRRTMYLVP